MQRNQNFTLNDFNIYKKISNLKLYKEILFNTAIGSKAHKFHIIHRSSFNYLGTQSSNLSSSAIAWLLDRIKNLVSEIVFSMNIFLVKVF